MQPRLFGGADFNSLRGHLISVVGQLVHRSAVAQYSKELDAALRASKGEWLLADLPPHALHKANHRFDGNVLLLTEDQGFTKAFGKFLPFCTDMGWYPYVKVTGFFTNSRLQTEIFPSLSVSLVEYKRPRSYIQVRSALLGFANFEIKSHRNYLKHWSDMVPVCLPHSYSFERVQYGAIGCRPRYCRCIEDLLHTNPK